MVRYLSDWTPAASIALTQLPERNPLPELTLLWERLRELSF